MNRITYRTVLGCGLLVLALGLASCASTPAPTRTSSSNTKTTGVDNSPGRDSGKYRNPNERTSLATSQVETADMKAATQQMVGDMLANPLLGGQPRPPHIVVDTSDFRVQTTSRFNKDMFVNQLRTGLIQAANGRLIFVDRQGMASMLRERQLRESGLVGGGALPDSPGMLGADYTLVGKVDETVIYASGVEDRTTQIQCEVRDQRTGQIVFSGIYDAQKWRTLNNSYR